MKWEEIQDALVGSVRRGTGDFLKSHKAAEDFLKERAERFAKLAAKYAVETDSGKRAALLMDMEIVKQTMENEITAVLVDVESSSRSLLKGLMGSVFDFAMRALPVLSGIL